MKPFRPLAAACGILLFFNSAVVRAQFEDVKTSGVRLDKTVVEKIKIGMTITAQGGPCNGIVGTAPVPTEWPDHKVQILREDVTPNVRKGEYRTIGRGTANQMIVHVPHFNPREEAPATVPFAL